MIGYRAMLEGDNEAYGGAEAVRAKLAFTDQKIYAGTEGMVADTVQTKWLSEFNNSKAKAVMTTTTKQAAGAASRAQRSDHRVGGGRGEDRAPPPNSPGPPPKFDHGTSLQDLTPEHQAWLDIETDRSLRSGTWGDWCFTFDLKDGYHAVGIDPDFQEFTQFDIQGVRYHSDSPRIFVKLMKTLVELIRSPQAGKDRHEVKKLRDGQEDDAFVQRDRVGKLLPRLGLFQNKKKGHWEPTQLVEHLGLEVDFEEGLFRVTEKRLKKIHAKATAILCRATRERRRVQARELAGFNGLCQSMYLAVPTARLYLRELYFVLGKKSNWGSKKEARGFWSDELRELHITHLELEAIYKTVRSFLSELEGKARYIHSEANEWADQVSRDKDLDDWRINKYAEEQWGEHSVDRFASEISAQLPRHWTEKLGGNQHSGTTAEMQAAALEKTTADNYERHWKKFVKFCTEENLQWLPATATTVPLYMAALQKSVVAFVTFGTPQTGTAMLRESLLRDNNGLSIVLEKEKGKKHLLCKRRLCIPREGVAELHELLDLFEQTRDEDWLQAASTSTAKAADTASYWRLP
eukprot:gene34267-biopygen23376